MSEYAGFGSIGEKQNEAGAGANSTTSQDFRQNHSRVPAAAPPAPPQPHELTAEWTVRAQLTFARAGEKVQRKYSSSDPVNPVRVVYKWSTIDSAKDDEEDNTSTVQSTKGSGHSTPVFKRQPSFRSNASSSNYADNGGGDSAFSGSNTSKNTSRRPYTKAHTTATSTAVGLAGASGPNGVGDATASLYGTRCRSTCNIIVSAVADFLPPNASVPTTDDVVFEEEESDPFVFNTTASYTVLPEQQQSLDDDLNFPKANKNFNKILALRDAFSQTSDTETKYFEERSKRPAQRKPYDHRRITSELSSQVDEANNFMPSFTPSPNQTFKSSSMSRISQLSGQTPPNFQQAPTKPKQSASSEPQKKPRTVHIDVYCTGSEDEADEEADNETSSSGDSEKETSKHYELDSNSTPQTVLDNEQMRLRHQRVVGQGMPRRLAQQNQPLQQSQSSDLHLGHGITKSSTAEEVSESKQLLFRKHIGDQRATKLQNLRQKYMRQPSDDALSTSYPNSSRSTVPRDATCSSISSAVPSNYADCGDSSWKETEDAEDLPSSSLAKSDSFEYENSLDRMRIRQMERFWGRSGVSSDEQAQHYNVSALQPISEVNSRRESPFYRNDTLPSESDQFSEDSNVYHTYPGRQRFMSSPNAVTAPSCTSPSMQFQHTLRNRPGFLQFFGPNAASPTEQILSPLEEPATAPVLQTNSFPNNNNTQLLYPNYQPNLQRWKSEGRDDLSPQHSITTPTTSISAQTSLRSSPQTAGATLLPPSQIIRAESEAPPTTTTTIKATNIQSPMFARRFDLKCDSPAASETSTVLSTVPGYTSEYLEKARKFGKVVATVRKPGHHVGPTKNPTCSCESCTRWMAERFQLRGRAFSLGERPVLKRPK